MSPIIEAAWIAVAGGVSGALVGVIGSTTIAISSARNTRRSVEVTIEAERLQRLWEKQAAAYEDVVKEMLLRRTQREYALSHGDIGSGPPALSLLLRRSDDPESVQVKALLLAYGSAAVQRTYEASEQVTVRVTQAAYNLNQVNDQLMRAQNSLQMADAELQEPLPDYGEALERLHALKAEAFEVDQQLFDAINHELAWRPGRSNGDPASPRAEHRIYRRPARG
jgi:hypothetical protein